jgi:hypothetical protein
MLTYEEENWNKWDGGYWGKDIYNTKKKSNNCFWISLLICCLSCWCLILLLYLVIGYKIVCYFNYIDSQNICLESNSTFINNNTFINNTNNTLFINNTNNTLFINNTNNDSFINDTQSNINNLPGLSKLNQINPLINQTNLSSLYIYQSNIRSDIEKEDKSLETGEAVAVSIGAVFGFIITTGLFFYGLKKGIFNLKNYCTYKTASMHNNIQLTEEELKFYQVKNPLQEAFENNQGGLFQKGVGIIKKAIEKDREREFEEAIKLYNDGIDTIIKCLKSDFNPNDRFALAKKNRCLSKKSQLYFKLC